MKNIHCITTREDLKPVLESYFENNQYNLLHYDPQNPTLADVRNLLIVEPLKIDDRHFSVAKIWKRYLARKFPNVRLIIASNREMDVEGHLELLNLPENFGTWIEQVPMTGNFQIEYVTEKFNGQDRETPYVPWENALDFQELDVLKRLLRFFDGHGKNSLEERLISIRQTMTVAYDELRQNDAQSLSYEELLDQLVVKYGVEEWETLKSRWEYYKPTFQYLPFMDTIEEIEIKVTEVKTFFDNLPNTKEKFMELECHKKLDEFYEKLHNEIEIYCRLDLYANQ